MSGIFSSIHLCLLLVTVVQIGSWRPQRFRNKFLQNQRPYNLFINKSNPILITAQDFIQKKVKTKSEKISAKQGESSENKIKDKDVVRGKFIENKTNDGVGIVQGKFIQTKILDKVNDVRDKSTEKTNDKVIQSKFIETKLEDKLDAVQGKFVENKTNDIAIQGKFTEMKKVNVTEMKHAVQDKFIETKILDTDRNELSKFLETKIIKKVDVGQGKFKKQTKDEHTAFDVKFIETKSKDRSDIVHNKFIETKIKNKVDVQDTIIKKAKTKDKINAVLGKFIRSKTNNEVASVQGLSLDTAKAQDKSAEAKRKISAVLGHFFRSQTNDNNVAAVQSIFIKSKTNDELRTHAKLDLNSVEGRNKARNKLKNKFIQISMMTPRSLLNFLFHNLVSVTAIFLVIIKCVQYVQQMDRIEDSDVEKDDVDNVKSEFISIKRDFANM